MKSVAIMVETIKNLLEEEDEQNFSALAEARAAPLAEARGGALADARAEEN